MAENELAIENLRKLIRLNGVMLEQYGQEISRILANQKRMEGKMDMILKHLKKR